MYDIFYVSRTNINNDDWEDFKKRFPSAQKLENVRSFDQLKSKAFTKMFWVVWNDVIVEDSFKLDYVVPKWDLEYIHVFKNDDHYDGITLFPKSAVVSDKEFKVRFYVNKKEIDVIASRPKIYDIFTINDYKDYLTALETSTTDMFWMTSKNIKNHPSFKFDFYIPHHNTVDRGQNHAFLHRVGLIESYNGIFLCSKNHVMVKKEIENRFPITRKEWPILASVPNEYGQYSFTIETYQDYLNALARTDTTELFWFIPSDVITSPDFNFETYFSHENDFDRKINHVFKNGDHYDGVMLLSKHKTISEKEFNHRFLVDKKEWDIVASTPKPFDIFYIDTFEEYQEALEKTTTEMFWMTSRNLTPAEDFKFDLYISHHNTIDRKQNHAFVHRVGNKDSYNGIFLCSKHVPLTKKEVEHRYPIERKEWDIVASGPVVYAKYVYNQNV